METAESILLLKEQVYRILKENPETRNSDRLLVWKVWQCYYEINDFITLKTYMSLPGEESISRCRRKIQETEFPPTSEMIAVARGWLTEEWQSALGYVTSYDPRQMVMQL